MTDAPSPRCSSGTIEAITRTVRDEWGSVLCYRDPVDGTRDCGSRRGCRCKDIACAVVDQHFSSCGAELNRHSGAVEMEKRAEQSNPGGGHEVTGQDIEKPHEQKAAGMIPRPAASSRDVAQASTGPREVLDALADKVSAKIAQLQHYKANDAQLDHAKTIAEGRISQANQILHWIAESAIRHTASPPAALPAETVTVPLEALRNCGCPADFRATVGQCEDSGQCGCSINLKGRAVSSTHQSSPAAVRAYSSATPRPPASAAMGLSAGGERIVPHEDCLNCSCSPDEQCAGVVVTSTDRGVP